jgi:large subunit ribosomal protein L9
MKVLLCEDIRKLGWLGDIVEVNQGYARNYLLPQGLAKVATEGNIRSLAKEKAIRSEGRIKERKRLEVVAAKVEGAEAVVAAKANDQGHLFGSVTEKDIAANLREQGFAVADEIVKMSEHIKEVGTHSVNLKFGEELVVSVNVVVVSDTPLAAKAQEADAAEVRDED